MDARIVGVVEVGLHIGCCGYHAENSDYHHC